MIKKNKKHILIGVCALAGVALTSVGFATWVVGVQKTNEDLKLNVEIDTATQNTAVVEINVKSGEQLRIAELAAVSDPNKNVTTVDTTTLGDFDIELDKYRIIVDNNHQVSSVTYEVYVGNTNDETAKNRFNAKAVNVSELIHPSYVDDSLSYIKLKTTNIESNTAFKSNFSIDTDITLEGHTAYMPNDSIIHFGWGNFFGADSNPAAFYEAKMDSVKDKTIEERINMSSAIIKEINGMSLITNGLAEGGRVVHIKVSIETEAKA